MTAEFAGFDDVTRDRLRSAARRLAAEFEGLYDRETIVGLLEESADQLSQGSVMNFVPVLAERFARERLRAQAQAEGRLAKAAREVVFVSLTGGGRAQLGAALLARRCGDAVSVHSAGSHASAAIEENVRIAMDEIGVDVSEAFTRPLTPEVLLAADIVVTMGRSVGEVEVPTSVRHVDWRVGDPTGADLDEVRRVRDDIERRIVALAEELLDRRPLAGAPAGDAA